MDSPISCFGHCCWKYEVPTYEYLGYPSAGLRWRRPRVSPRILPAASTAHPQPAAYFIRVQSIEYLRTAGHAFVSSPPPPNRSGKLNLCPVTELHACAVCRLGRLQASGLGETRSTCASARRPSPGHLHHANRQPAPMQPACTRAPTHGRTHAWNSVHTGYSSPAELHVQADGELSFPGLAAQGLPRPAGHVPRCAPPSRRE